MNVGPSCLIPSSPIPSSPSRRIRIVTFNICGIRNVLQYHPWNVWRNWTMMFDMLDADIICFQETKIQRKDIEESMAIVPGFESFFSFSRYKKGYSGVAVYTRNAVCRPFKAEEGITGCLESCDIGSNGRKASYRELERSIGGYDYLINSSEGQEIDSEGRTVVLDFGKFVLICVYCPANSSGDRSRYRETFLTTLNNRIRQLVEIEMREVVLVGDINIIRDRIDTADPGECVKEGDNTDFKATFARQLLDTLLVPNPTGILVDLCRQYFPQREGMYTCWNQKINARPGNYGSRLDYLLCTKALSNACSAASILPELLGSDHCPVYGDFQFPIDSAKKITADPEDTPRLASRYFPEFLGRRSIKDMFKTPCPRNSASWRISVQAEQEFVGDAADKSERQLEQAQHLPEPELLRKRKLEPSTGTSKRSNQQKKLTSFFKQPLSHSGRDVVTDSDDELACDTVDCKMFGRENTSVSSAIEKGSRRSPNTVATRKTANLDWRVLFQKPQAPCCTVHGEPCIQLVTRKSGPNEGRAFWICSRPVGPGYQTAGRPTAEVNRDFRCSFFKCHNVYVIAWKRPDVLPESILGNQPAVIAPLSRRQYVHTMLVEETHHIQMDQFGSLRIYLVHDRSSGCSESITSIKTWTKCGVRHCDCQLSIVLPYIWTVHYTMSTGETYCTKLT